MEEKTKNELLKGYSFVWYAAFALVGIIFIGLYYFFYPEPTVIKSADSLTVVKYTNHSIWFILLKEVGIAILIAVVLIMTIEKFSHKKKEIDLEEETEKNRLELIEKENQNKIFLENCTTNVLQSVYKRYIPESTFVEVERCLLRGHCSRTDYLIDYTIRDFNQEDVDKYNNNGSGEHFIVDVYSSYTLINMLDEEVKTDVFFGLEVPNEKEYSEITEITSFKVRKAEEITEAVKVSSHGECHFKSNVTLSPLEQVTIEMRGTTIKRKIDSEVWASRLPSDGIRVIVRAPENLEIHCKANNSHMMKKVSTNFWELNHGIFPHQSIVLWWNGKNK